MGLFEALKNKKEKNPFSISSPLNGKIIPQEEIEDKVFVDEAIGKGVGILVKNEMQTLVAPISGVISMIFPTKHAIGICTDEGIEVLIHIGIDTVKLEGNGFESYIQEGDIVKAHDKLLNVNLDIIKNSGYSTQTMMVLAQNENLNIEVYPNEYANKYNEVIKVKKNNRY